MQADTLGRTFDKNCIQGKQLLVLSDQLSTQETLELAIMLLAMIEFHVRPARWVEYP